MNFSNRNLFLVRVLVVGIAFYLMNLIYINFFFERDILNYSPLISQIREIPDSSEIIYFGESSNITFSPADLDKRSIASFINDYYPDKDIAQVGKGALHAGIYKVLLENIPETSKVKTIIVTLNLRSFDANWIYSNLETGLQKEIVMIKPDLPPLFRRFVLSFKGYDNKSEDQRKYQYLADWRLTKLKFPFYFPYPSVTYWDKAMNKTGILDSAGKRDSANTELACHFIKTYAFQIDTLKNPRIKDFDDIVKLAHKRGWNIVFNLLAENTEKANKLVGKELTWLMRQNRDLLIKRYTSRGAIVVDNLECVADSDYIDQHWTTEHYCETGRKIIAKNVALSIQHLYMRDYTDLKTDTVKARNDFSNNCEGRIIWSQMQTLTNAIAHSGKKSSKVYNDDKYSVTFEWPIKEISFDSYDSVSIELYYYQHIKNKEALLYLTIEGGTEGYFSVSKKIAEFNIPLNSWTKVNETFKLPENKTHSGIIKVFVMNSESEPVYIDDWFIRFY
jgi:hypothetical protein